MDQSSSIIISNVSKSFTKNDGSFYALKNINLTIEKGEVLGIIGKNGSGKSTLLKILSGIYKPDSGRIEMYGSVASILDVGAGMHPDLTGRQNVYLRGQLLGLKKKEIDEIFHELVSFSEVADFIDTPVKHYSSGMFVRLAFSIVVFLKADILILDEVMSVGDVGFMEKCNQKLLELTKNKETTVVLVGHNINQIYNIANRAITLSEGALIFEGDTATAIEHYVKLTKSYFSPDSFESTGIVIDSTNVSIKENKLSISLYYKSNENFYYPVVRIKKLNQEVLLIDTATEFSSFKDSISIKNKLISLNISLDLSHLFGGKFFVHYFFADGNYVYEASTYDSFVLETDISKQNLLLKADNLTEISFKC